MAVREIELYALRHPQTLEIRYIGKTERGAKTRFREHLYASIRKGSMFAVHCWIRKLHSEDLVPDLHILERVPPGGDWIEAEKDWIALYNGSNRLLNLTVGGDGTTGRKMSEENKRQVGIRTRLLLKGKPGWMRGHKHTDQARRNMSEAHKGIKKGVPWTPVQRAAHANRKYAKWTPERREKTMLARQGYKATPEHRKSLSEAAKRDWAKRKGLVVLE